VFNLILFFFNNNRLTNQEDSVLYILIKLTMQKRQKKSVTVVRSTVKIFELIFQLVNETIVNYHQADHHHIDLVIIIIIIIDTVIVLRMVRHHIVDEREHHRYINVTHVQDHVHMTVSNFIFYFPRF
jgi:hypothetical protein